MQMVLPEQILIADGDGGKVDALRVDDLNINSFRIISQVDQPLTHEPQEKPDSAENSDRPQYTAKTRRSRAFRQAAEEMQSDNIGICETYRLEM